MNNKINTVEEFSREISVVEDVDVLVAGGGAAGIAAALAAAREGANTLLVERYGYLGGMITGANVVAIIGAGDGKDAKVRGITLEIRRRLEKLDAVKPIRCGDYRVDNEIFKWQSMEMLLEAGVKIRLHTLACMPIIEEQDVVGVFTESKSGREAFRAKVVVDATADADIVFRAGCTCDNEVHEVTLVTKIEDVDRKRVDEFLREYPDEYKEIVHKAEKLNGGVMPGRTRNLKGIDVTDAEALTQAEIKLRRELFRALIYLRENLPGYENARVLTYPQFGVRQSRRIHGEYVLVDDDLRNSRHFDDGIARLGVYFPDWGPNYAIEGLDYDIPYRCLVPESVDELLVAGRCISCDYKTCNSMRLIVPCLATGQAAGCASAVSVKDDCPPRKISIDKLRETLLKQDVYLG